MGSLELTDLPQDMTKDEKVLVLEFIQNGCPGIMKVQHEDSYRFFELYMSGKTYAEIAVITKVSKTLIMFLSYKMRWMEHRFKHYEGISLNLLDKIQKAKLDIANNLLTTIAATGKYLENEYNRYLRTNDKSIIESLDQKIVSSYQKSVDSLKRVLEEESNDDPNKKPKQPLVNINVGMGAKATLTEPNKLEITDATAGELLTALAGIKKSMESK